MTMNVNSDKHDEADAVSDEKTEIKLSDAVKEETLHDSALRGHVATDT